MTLHIDPEENEIRALREATDWPGKHVLEIGCGEGRLTRRLLELGASVQAIDPDAGLVRKARGRLPKRFAERVRFRTGRAEKLDHADDESFDAVVFAWAL